MYFAVKRGSKKEKNKPFIDRSLLWCDRDGDKAMYRYLSKPNTVLEIFIWNSYISLKHEIRFLFDLIVFVHLRAFKGKMLKMDIHVSEKVSCHQFEQEVMMDVGWWMHTQWPCTFCD